MAAETYVERRVFGRVFCSLRGAYISSTNKTGEAVCCDISALGVRFNTTVPLFVDERIRLSFIAKKRVPFCVEGKVRWCNKGVSDWQIGMAFDKPLFFPLEIVV